MFGDLNRSEIIGNITSDLQVRYTGSGTAVASFGVATNRSYRSPGSDEWKDETEFHNVVVWAKQAEMLAERAKKGTRVFISGRLQTRSWEDSDGKKNYKTEIVANEIILLDRYERGPSKGGGKSGANEAISGTRVSDDPNASPNKGQKNEKVIDPDDLPF